jgi:hypothetical protein
MTINSSSFSSLDATVRASDRLWACRLAAGWDCDPEYGWGSPCGTTLSDWEDNGYPLPEDPEFPDWASTFYHHDAIDTGELAALEQQLAAVRAAQAAHL